MKKILITRPKNQSQELVKFFETQKIEAFVEPIFEVEELLIEKIGKKFSALIITSLNACFALKNLGISKNIKIFTVGKKTAQRLKALGFINVVLSPENSAKSLINAVKNHEDEVLYLRGEKISFDFAQKFSNISEIVVYKIHEHQSFSDEFLEFCQNNSFDEILIFSQNSAEIFFRLVKKHNLLEYFSKPQIVCLSNKILTNISKFGFSKISTFDENSILQKFYD